MYRGTREFNKNGATGEITITDTREVDPEKELKVASCYSYYNDQILEAVPDYIQRNIGMGIIVDPEAAAYIKTINDLRLQSSTDVTNINKCTTLEEFDLLNLPY